MATLVVAITSLSGCQAQGSRPPEPEPEVTVPRIFDGERILLDRHQNIFYRYELASGRILDQTSWSNYFAYEFTSLASTFTAADSSLGGSEVLRRRGDGLRELHRAPAGEDLLPLADDGNRTFLIQTETATDLTRRIVELMPDGELRRVRGEHGLVYSGALVGNSLYISSYQQQKESFTILLLDLSRDAEARVLRTGLKEGRLLILGDELFVARGDRIFGVGRSLPCLGLCYFAGGALLDYRSVGSGVPGPGSVLLVRDVARGQVVARFPRVIDFSVRGQVLTLYTNRGVRTATLPAGSRPVRTG